MLPIVAGGALARNGPRSTTQWPDRDDAGGEFVVPSDYTGYFTAAAAAAGVLIGLLFVAIALRPETVFGEDAAAAGRAQAGSAFIGLVNCFFVSLVALIPQAGVGGVSVTIAIISLLATLRLHREVAKQELQAVMLAASLAFYLFQLGVGLAVLFSPSSTWPVECVAYIIIGQISVALGRAWSLMEGRHLAASSRKDRTEHRPDRPGPSPAWPGSDTVGGDTVGGDTVGGDAVGSGAVEGD
jgi:hypothetical protein